MRRFPSDRPRARWRWAPVFFLAAAVRLAAAGAPAGEGEPLMRYFSPREYHADTQCLCTVQDARGVVYIGNIGSVVEYDGSAWRKIDVGHLHAVAGLAYEARTDTVFVGARDDVGYLRRLPDGTRAFVSLLDRLPPGDRDVGIVLGVFATPEGVYFVGTKQVMRWREGRFRTWTLATGARLRSNWAGGHLYVYAADTGLLRLEGDAFVSASADPLFRRGAARAIMEDAAGNLLVGTYHDGLFILRDGRLQPFENECSDFLKEKGFFKMALLSDGSLAIATDSAGMLVLDRAGRFRCHFDEVDGLHGGNVTNLFVDAEDGLWICLQTGFTRAEINSPLSILRAGADEDFSSVSTDDNPGPRILLNNRHGIYRLVPADAAAATGAHLEPIPGLKGEISSFCVVANGLLVVAGEGVSLLGAGGELAPVATVRAPLTIRASRVHPGRAYVASMNGQVGQLHLEPSSGRWIDDGVVATVGGPGDFEIVESARGNLWLGTKDQGLFLVRLPPAGPAAVTSFLERPGPLRGKRYVLAHDYGGSIIFNALDALYRPDAQEENVEPLAEFGPRLTDGSLSFYNLLFADPRSLWIIAHDEKDPAGASWCGRILAAEKGRGPVFQPLPHKVMEVLGEPRDYLKVGEGEERLNTLLIDGASGHGMVRLDLRQWEARLAAPRSFDTLIRRSVVIDQPAPGRGLEPISLEPLPYARNSLHFGYAAGTLAFGASPQFQTRLAGLGGGRWSEWSERTSVDYLNLPEGRYTFEARARNADGQMGRVAAFPFHILPPWQRTPWACALYVMAAALAVLAFVRRRGRRLELRNAALEALVDARTSELRGREAELLANQHALVRAREDAEAANRAKSAFLANMSHELRTPLNAVLGYTQLLLKQPDLAPRSRERIGVIGQSGSHLLALVNEVLDLSKVEAGKLTLSPSDFSLGQLLDEVRAAFRPRLAEKGLTFTENRAPGLPAAVRADGSRLRQVLFNLLSNATKFTHRGGVTLTVRPTQAGGVRFEVADTGVGIAPEEQRDIFLPFHQVGETRLAAQGTGLGLAISQRLVELLGGRIEVASTPGEGSRFWFELPLAAAAPSGGLAAGETAGPAMGRVMGYEGAPRWLLLVDDLAENRRVLRDFLQPLGFEIEEAADGEGCLEACARRMPDAVLLDLRLGAVDGFEVARTLRARPGGAPLGIIAISASVFESDRQQAIDAGCDDFLPKPFEEAQLLGTLRRVLGLRWTLAHGAPPDAAAAPDTPEGGAMILPREETAALTELSLRGDVVGIRRRLDALRAAGVPEGAAPLVRRLEALAANYQMDDIHTLLLSLQAHDGN